MSLLTPSRLTKALYHGLWEISLTLAVAWGLHHMALGFIHVSGLGGRYSPAPDLLWVEFWRGPWPSEPLARAAWLLWAAPAWLPTWVLLGAIGLLLLRRRGYFTPDQAGVARSLLWPLFAALSGLAWIAIADFAAGADPEAGLYGLKAAYALGAATAMAWVGAAGRPLIGRLWLAGAQTLAKLGQTRCGRLLLWLLGGLMAVLLGWLGRPTRLDGLPLLGKGLGMPHVSGEILRLWLCLGAAWWCYRAMEWSISSNQRWQLFRGLLIQGGLVFAGLALSSDSGPMLVIALMLGLLLALPPLRYLLQRRAFRLALPLAGLLMVLAMAGWRYGVNDLASAWSVRGAERNELRQHPELAKADDLMRIHWLMDAAPSLGFGPGGTPWCGAAAQVGEKPCHPRASRKYGAPLQTPEDFALALWVARYGLWVAGWAVVTTLIWLLALLLTAMPRRWPSPGQFDHRQMRAYALFWVLAVSALSLLAQIVLATGGTLGWVSLSGVPLPLMAFGKTSLGLCALWLGLALGRD